MISQREMFVRGRAGSAARLLRAAGLLFLLGGLAAKAVGDEGEPAANRYFEIHVLDAGTGRGIPLVELETTSNVRYYTDSAGRAAIHEPGLTGRRVFFRVRSPGYEFPKRGWFRGVRVELQPGGTTTIEMERQQIAERLYRVTGQGIYRDTVLLGKETPIEKSLLNAQVTGQDSVHTAVYRGSLYWFWGDTNRPSFPLGNFETTGAVTRLTGEGGPDPDVGVNLSYFRQEDGFVRKMCPIEGPGPVWTTGHTVLERDGEPVMLCHYARMKNLGERLEHGIAAWNDEKKVFEKVREFPLEKPLHPVEDPVRVKFKGREWLYYAYHGYPVIRVRALWKHVLDPTKYEAFTCLKPGARWDADDPPIERDADGNPVWGWKADTAPVHGPAGKLDEVADDADAQPQDIAVDAVGRSRNREWFLRGRGLLGSEQGIAYLRDVETGEPVLCAHRSSLSWNAWRRKWVMLMQSLGDSGFGEVWYAESDTLLGPWVYARRVAGHGGYSFYNVKQHPYFAEQGGRRIYFEGTYTKMFTDKPATPLYNYNQIMYRLDLEDERLSLPAPVYEMDESGERRYGTWRAFEGGAPAAARVPFYAIPPDRSHAGTVTVSRVADEGETAPVLRVGENAGNSGEPLFRALPAGEDDMDVHATVPLFQYRHAEDGGRLYRPADRKPAGNYVRAENPLCRVWRSPRLDPPRSAALPVDGHRGIRTDTDK